MSARFRSLIVSSALVAGVLAGPGAGSALAAYTWSVTPSVAEGSNATVTVTRSGLALLDPGSVTITAGLQGDTAVAGSDYTAPSPPTNTLSWSALETGAKTLEIEIRGDTVDENDEKLTVRVTSNTSEAVTPPADPTVTITDDPNDLPPMISIGNASINEGTGANPTVIAFPVTLSVPSGKTITANFATANGTATAGQDYTAKSSPPPLSIPAGATTSTIHVALNADNVDEADETLVMTLSALSNVTAGTLTATGTIRNDDVPSLAVGNVAVTETNASQTTEFSVSLSNPSTRTITVAFATADNSATAGSDYTATSGTLTFAPGETQKAVPVEILGDAAAEGREAFALTLSAPVGATLGAGTGIGGITDDDAPATSGAPSGPDVGFGPGVVPGGGTDTTPPAMKVSRPTLARSGVLRLRMACPASERSCRGTVSVFSRPAPKSKIKALRGEVKIAKTNFVIDGGKEARLTLRLSKRVLGLLRRVRTVHVTAFIVSRDAAGNIGTKQIRGTLKRPRR